MLLDAVHQPIRSEPSVLDNERLPRIALVAACRNSDQSR